MRSSMSPPPPPLQSAPAPLPPLCARWMRPKRESRSVLTFGGARVLAFHRIQHLAGDAREQRVVASHADVRAGMHLRAALAHQDLTGIDPLAAERLDAEALGLGIAPVARAAARFLVSHALPLQDIVYADLGVGLPMALRFLVVLAPAQLEDLQFLAAPVRHHRTLHLGAGDERRADLQVVAFADEQYFVERDRRADFSRQRLHAQLRAGLNTVLLAAGLDHCVHELLHPQRLAIISES